MGLECVKRAKKLIQRCSYFPLGSPTRANPKGAFLRDLAFASLFWQVNLEKCDPKPWLDLTCPSEKPEIVPPPTTNTKPPQPSAAKPPPTKEPSSPTATAFEGAAVACDACKPEPAPGPPRRHHEKH